MKRNTSLFVILALMVALLLVGGIACAEGGVSSLAQLNAPGMTVGVGQGSADGIHWQAYNGKTLGILTGTNMEAATLENFPDSDYLYLNGYPDCNAALLAGKIDGYLGDEPELKSIHAEQPKIDYIHEYLTYNEYNFAFRKNDPDSDALREELNAWLAESWENGTMDEIDAIWFGADEDRKVVDMSDLTGENGTIKVVTTSTDMPFSYIKDGKNVGYDIDVVVRFCRDRGYALELIDVDFAARIPALQSGKADFTTSMNVTPEREEEVNFSNLVSSGGMLLGRAGRGFGEHRGVRGSGRRRRAGIYIFFRFEWETGFHAQWSAF